MDKNKPMKIKELTSILEQEYYNLATTGSEAITNMLQDFEAGRFAENIQEWGISQEKLLRAINLVIDKLFEEDKLDKPAIPIE